MIGQAIEDADTSFNLGELLPSDLQGALDAAEADARLRSARTPRRPCLPRWPPRRGRGERLGADPAEAPPLPDASFRRPGPDRWHDDIDAFSRAPIAGHSRP